MSPIDDHGREPERREQAAQTHGISVAGEQSQAERDQQDREGDGEGRRVESSKTRSPVRPGRELTQVRGGTDATSRMKTCQNHQSRDGGHDHGPEDTGPVITE